ncbi:restriction endonuclease subunit S [Marinobacter sp. ANT_B65]|uniref:restriction endonuclease subunit S n=1 Tax=Marinobacter sp. ANT_B65 TaxID=2039467 RepID=UPI0026D131A4
MRLRLPLPPLAEQKVIADKLDTLLAQVENSKARLERIPKILKRFRQSVLSAAVSGRLTEEWRGSADLANWESDELGRFIEKPRYGSSSKSQKSGDVPVLRVGNLQDGRLDWADLVYTCDPEEIEKYRLEPGDVLFNRTNSPELVGKTSIFRGERNAIYAGYLIKIKCLSSLNPEFLNYQLNSPKAKDYCKAHPCALPFGPACGCPKSLPAILSGGTDRAVAQGQPGADQRREQRGGVAGEDQGGAGDDEAGNTYLCFTLKAGLMKRFNDGDLKITIRRFARVNRSSIHVALLGIIQEISKGNDTTFRRLRNQYVIGFYPVTAIITNVLIS